MEGLAVSPFLNAKGNLAPCIFMPGCPSFFPLQGFLLEPEAAAQKTSVLYDKDKRAQFNSTISLNLTDQVSA
jgi:hypothetical protein